MSLTRAERTRRREALAAEREVEAFRLRADHGFSFEQIAERLGITRSAAWKSYGRRLKIVRELVDPDEVREHVDLQLHRLDLVLQVAVAVAQDDSTAADVRLRAVDRVVRIEARRAALLGLDAVARIELGVRAIPAPEQLSAEQLAQELEAFGMPAAIAIAAGPDHVVAPQDA
jgi:AcrR family transcriptional regulator